MCFYLGLEKFNEINFVEGFYFVFCRVKLDKFFFDKCFCLKLFRILSKNICCGFFFLLVFRLLFEICEGKCSFCCVKFCCKYKN